MILERALTRLWVHTTYEQEAARHGRPTGIVEPQVAAQCHQIEMQLQQVVLSRGAAPQGLPVVVGDTRA